MGSNINQINYVLDACSIINLIHIDEDNFILDKLDCLSINMSDEVFKEVNVNIYNKYNNKNIYNLSKDEKEENRKRIDKIISSYRRYKISNDVVLYNMKSDFYEIIKKKTNYKKENGEFYSIALSSYLSRSIPSKVFFITDDYPAKKDFDQFFLYNQIGAIEDSVDLLMLLYWLDEEFKLRDLDRMLSRLSSEYASDISLLTKCLRAYNIPKRFIRDHNLRRNLSNLISDLSNHDFERANGKLDFFKQKKYKTINKILNNYSTVFTLKSNKNIIKKIREYRANLSNNPPYLL